jgi:hypothetical protein
LDDLRLIIVTIENGRQNQCPFVGVSGAEHERVLTGVSSRLCDRRLCIHVAIILPLADL